MKLTLPQQDVYFEQLLHPDEPIYNIGAKIAIKGNIIYKQLNEAYIALIDQHDSYRSILVGYGENPELKILDTHESTLGFKDFSKERNPDEYAKAYMRKEFKTAFDFKTNGLLHKFVLIKVEDRFHYLFSMYHHIITDGWGASLMFQRLVQNYNELIESGGILKKYPFSYRDFVSFDKDYYDSEEFYANKMYWTKRFKKFPEPLFDKKEKNININKSLRKELIIRRSKYNLLAKRAKDCKSSTFHFILGILFMYFGRKYSNNNFAIGLPVLNRSKSVFKKTVGLFMGITALRIPLDFENTFEDLVVNIKQQLRRDYRHQRFPIGKLIKELGLVQNKEKIFNLTLSYEKQNYADHFKDTETKVIPLSHESERVALAIYIREFDELEDVKIDFDFNTNYFDKNSINQVATHFEKLIDEVSLNSGKKLSEYQYITPLEKKQVLKNFNLTHFSYSKDKTLLSYLEKQVKEHPEKNAVKDNDTNYSYKELDTCATRLANYIIQAFEYTNQSPIAVLMDRSADLLVILIGILKSGRPFIPLDPNFPKNRLQYILSHSGVNSIISSNKYDYEFNDDISYIDATSIIHSETKYNSHNLKDVGANYNAYIIYTSGSTGLPKGVVVGHQSLLNFLLSIVRKPGINTNDILFSVTTPSFDISLLEFFAPLISGATVHISQKNKFEDPLSITKELQEVKPTIIQATPSFYQMLYEIGWQGDTNLKVLCGGDLLSASLAQKLKNTNGSVWNMYGPTETTIWSSIKEIFKSEDAFNIGKPIHNTQFYILDKYLKPLPVESIGTIYIGGDGLAKGYYKDKKLTTAKFIDSPFENSKKIYNTGDLGKWNSNGEVVFIGRNDHQVKIRGYRIELEEIETKLNQLKTVRFSVVVPNKKSSGNPVLIAFIILEDSDFDEQTMIDSLRKQLPEYMIPYIIIPVDSFPLTPNGKIDRKSLMLRNENRSNLKPHKKKPKSDLEIILSQYYQEVLEINENISITDNFFSLGGHSLNAIKLISIINDRLKYRLTFRDIFEYATIETLSSFLQNKKKHQQEFIRPTKEKPYYPITPSQYAIWLACQNDKRLLVYNMSKVYMIEGNINREVLNQAFIKIIRKHEILRTNFVEYQGIPSQKIRSKEDSSFKIDYKEVEDLIIDDYIEEYIHQEFHLENDILLRVGLFQNNDANFFLVFSTHHILMDMWSLQILINEITKYYKCLISEMEIEEEMMNFQFKDYTIWQLEEAEKVKNRNSHFWTKYLEKYRWKNLLTSANNGKVKEYSGSEYNFSLDSNLTACLNKIVVDKKSTWHIILITAFNILIHKTQGITDICLGTVNSGRNFPNSNLHLGMFVKTLPLRTKIDSELTFSSLLEDVKENLLNIDEFQDIPEAIQKTLQLDVMFVYQNSQFDFNTITIDQGLKLKSYPVKSIGNRFPFLIEFSEEDDSLFGRINYRSDKYDNDTVELLILKFKRILEQIIDDPSILIQDLDIQLKFAGEEEIDIKFDF